MDNIRSVIGSLTINAIIDDPTTADSGDGGRKELQDVVLSMRSLGEITGAFQASSAPNLVSIIMPNLTSVTRNLHLHDLVKLETANLTSLNRVGSLVLENLPALRTFQVDAGVNDITGYEDPDPFLGPIDPYLVVDNTGLSKLESFTFSNITTFQITNNRNLESIVMGLTETRRAQDWNMKITNNISLNGGSKTTLNFPHLFKLDTQNTEFRDISEIQVPRLRKVWGSLLIGDSPFMTSFNATRLVEIYDNLIFEWNSGLTSIVFPALRTVNSLTVEGTKALEQPDGVSFGDLRAIKDVYISGESSKVDCQPWDNRRCTGLITTVYTCGSDWKNRKQVEIAADPEECQLTHPIQGWTKAKKTQVRFRVFAAATFLIATIFLLVRYRQSLRDVDYRNALRNALAGKYLPVNDEGEGREIEMRDVEGGASDFGGSRDNLLPRRNAVNGTAGPSLSP